LRRAWEANDEILQPRVEASPQTAALGKMFLKRILSLSIPMERGSGVRSEHGIREKET